MTTDKPDVLNDISNVLNRRLVLPLYPKVTPAIVLDLATKKYNNFHLGINFTDLEQIGCKKRRAQSILKRLCCETYDKVGRKQAPFLFRSPKRTSPRVYYPFSLKADIMEYLSKKGIVPIDPTEVSTSLITPFAKSTAPLSIAIETKRANSFLEALILIPFQPAYIHNIHLQLSINQDEYEYAIGKEEEQCRGNVHHERVGCVKGLENVRYIMYPKGKVMVYVKCSENPFRLQTENDVSYFFSYLGQVRDRIVLWLNDLRETVVPSIMQWYLWQCDINRDVELTSTAQIILPKIQLPYVDRVFRLYVKSLGDKAVFREEEFLTMKQILPEALDCILNPYKSVNAKLDLILSLIATLNQTKLE